MIGIAPTEASVRVVADRDFEVEKSPEPTVVNFVSAECPHCETLMPYIEGFARDFRGRLRFVTMDVFANPLTAERYGICGTPIFKFFCHGRSVLELVGAIPQAAIKRQVEEFVVHAEECVWKSTGIDDEITGYRMSAQSLSSRSGKEIRVKRTVLLAIALIVALLAAGCSSVPQSSAADGNERQLLTRIDTLEQQNAGLREQARPAEPLDPE